MKHFTSNILKKLLLITFLCLVSASYTKAYTSSSSSSGDRAEVQDRQSYSLTTSDIFLGTEKAPAAANNSAIRIPDQEDNKTKMHYQFRFDDALLGDHSTDDNRSRNITMSVWIKPRNLNGHLFGLVQSDFWGSCGTFWVKAEGGKYALGNRTSTAAGGFQDQTDLVTDQTVVLNEWAFVTIVINNDAKQRSIYYNGTLLKTSQIENNGLGMLPDASVFFVGNGIVTGSDQAITDDACMDIDEVQVWTRALTADEVKSSMKNVDLKANGLAYLYRFTSKNADNTYSNLAQGDIKASLVYGKAEYATDRYATIYSPATVAGEQVEGHTALAPSTYTVTWSAPQNGNLTVKKGSQTLSSPASVEESTVLNIEATPDNGYELEALTANGASIMSEKQITVTSDVTIVATFKEKEEPAISYCTPTYTNDEGNDFNSSKMQNTYVERITVQNGDVHKEWSHSERVFYNVLPELAIDAKKGETVNLHLVGHSLGDYNESTILQDLRFTAAVLAIDWNHDGEFEFVEKIAGSTPPANNIGGNMDVLDIQKDIQIPADATAGIARVRVNYTNAWWGDNTIQNFICTSKEGIVYDFDINITEEQVPTTYNVTWKNHENGTVIVKKGDEVLTSPATLQYGETLKIEATANPGYMFVNWQNELNENVISYRYIYNLPVKEDIDLIANFAEEDYPIMTRFYVVDLNQQNRYLANVTYNAEGEAPKEIFNSTNESELPFTLYKQLNVAQAEGAVIDKTENPVRIKEGTPAFYMKFKQYNRDITINNGVKDIICTPELVWTKQVVYIDWNNDKKFEGVDEIYNGVGIPGDNNNFEDNGGSKEKGWSRRFPVPTYVKKGTYRMRVVYTAFNGIDEKTLFTEGFGEIRNGHAYDFAIVVEEGTGIENTETNRYFYDASAQEIVADAAETVMVYDLTGRLVLKSEGNERTSLATLANGVYTAVVGKEIIKFIK